MSRFLLAAVALVVVALPALAQDGWVNLCNGKDLDGWVQKGGEAKYRVENGEIVGGSVPKSPNSFLCTKKEYGNFILELEFKTVPGLNSGVQLRSHCFEAEKVYEFNGVKKKVAAGRVHGYQCEIDPSDRAFTGGIYDEGRRAWLKDLKDNEPARKAYKTTDWNKFHIECRGDMIKTQLNGVPAAELKDTVDPAGFIALQVHGVGKKEDTLEVRFRNIRIQELK